MSRKRKNTKHQLALRETLERELEAIAPLSKEHLRLLSNDGLSTTTCVWQSSIQHAKMPTSVWSTTSSAYSTDASMPIYDRC